MNNIIPKQHNDVSLIEKPWGVNDDLNANDLLVSKIYHQQALSQFVQDGIASAGDWCDSLTGEVLAKRDEHLEIITFASYKKLLISKSALSNGSFEFIEAQDLTLDNCSLPWLEEVNGESIKRQLQYNYFCLLPSKIAELPYVLSFSSTKIKVAKKLNTMIAKLSRIKKPSAAYVFNLTSVKETGDKGNWYGVDISQGRETTPEEMNIAYEWYLKVKSGSVKVSEQSVESTETKEINSDEYFAKKPANPANPANPASEDDLPF